MIDYSLRELECFLAVADELSFTRAARRLRLAQPPLSRHIQTLELRLGTKLFTRSPRAVALTPAGRAFWADTKEAITQLQRAGDAAKRAARGETARLDLGFVSAVLNPRLINLFQQFRNKCPEVQLMLHDSMPAEQVREIHEGKLDGGFVGLAPATSIPGLTLIPWMNEPLMVFVPPGHRLTHAKKVGLLELAGEAFVAVTPEMSPAFSAQVQTLCREAGFLPRIVQQAARGQAVAVMVAAGAGIAILPASLVRITGESLVAIPLKDKNASLNHVFAYPTGAKEPLLRHFVQELKREPRDARTEAT